MIAINQAIARAQERGIQIKKKDVAARLWANSSKEAQSINMTSLCTGKTRKIDPDWVDIICEMCECTPNFLFGYADNN